MAGHRPLALTPAPMEGVPLAALQTWDFPSKSKPSLNHTARLDVAGLISCSCPAWQFKRSGKGRTCPHLRAVVNELSARGARIEQVGDHTYAHV